MTPYDQQHLYVCREFAVLIAMHKQENFGPIYETPEEFLRQMELHIASVHHKRTMGYCAGDQGRIDAYQLMADWLEEREGADPDYDGLYTKLADTVNGIIEKENKK